MLVREGVSKFGDIEDGALPVVDRWPTLSVRDRLLSWTGCFLLFAALLIKGAVPAGYMIDWSALERSGWPVSLCSDHRERKDAEYTGATPPNHGDSSNAHIHFDSRKDGSKQAEPESCAFSSLISPGLLVPPISVSFLVVFFFLSTQAGQLIAILLKPVIISPPATGPPTHL